MTQDNRLAQLSSITKMAMSAPIGELVTAIESRTQAINVDGQGRHARLLAECLGTASLSQWGMTQSEQSLYGAGALGIGLAAEMLTQRLNRALIHAKALRRCARTMDGTKGFTIRGDGDVVDTPWNRQLLTHFDDQVQPVTDSPHSEGTEIRCEGEPSTSDWVSDVEVDPYVVCHVARSAVAPPVTDPTGRDDGDAKPTETIATPVTLHLEEKMQTETSHFKLQSGCDRHACYIGHDQHASLNMIRLAIDMAKVAGASEVASALGQCPRLIATLALETAERAKHLACNNRI